VGIMLEKAIDDIEQLTPGDPPPLATLNGTLSEFEHARPNAGRALTEEIRQQLATFDPVKIFGEIASYEVKAVDAQHSRALTSVLVLLGVPLKSIEGSWKSCSRKFRDHRGLHHEMLQLELESEDPAVKKRWDQFHKLTKNLDLDALSERVPTPTALLIKWVDGARTVRNICLALLAESRPPPPNPAADQMFDLIDADGDQNITINELLTFMIREYPNRVAHAVLRTFDSDADNQISREEWRKGWDAGLLSKAVLESSQAIRAERGETAGAPSDEPTVGVGRMGGKRSSVGQSAAMTAAIAAQQASTSSASGGSSKSVNSTGEKSAGKKGKKK